MKKITCVDRMTVHFEEKPCYDILFQTGFEALAKELECIDQLNNRKIAIISDSNVAPLYANEVSEVLKPICKDVVVFTFEAGEKSKTLATIQTIYQFLIEHSFQRSDLLLALGGGVVGDMTGFAAATYLRGVDFIQVPTSVLAMVDSSVGGKTGVDFDQYKNMVGAFHMPKLLYTNFDVLKTLPERELCGGIAEVLKAGLIKDATFYEWIINHFYEILELDSQTIHYMIQRSCEIKRDVVENDPFEKGDRALLNFGHTLGHAIEKASHFELSHGECVALGMVAASFISWKRDYIIMEEYYEIRDMFVPFSLPISIQNISFDQLLDNMKSDKKVVNDSLRFILLKKVGEAIIDSTVTKDELKAAFDELEYKEED